MNDFNFDDDRLKEAFSKAYREKPAPGPGERFVQNVMRSVRKSSPVSEEKVALVSFDRYFWRFAAVTGVIIIAMSTALWDALLITDQELVDMIIDESISSTFFNSFDT